VLVRKLPKDYGAGTQKPKVIDCMSREAFAGKQALLCEDLITDGGSKRDFITAIRDSGAKVDDCFVFVDRQQGGAKELADMNVRLYSMTDLDTILIVGRDIGTIDEEGFKSIERYRADPPKWHSDFMEKSTGKT
jgi:orotate phosphoribosyltransferase